MRLHCNACSKSVSNEVPEETVVRAWLECPECTKELMCDEDVALKLALEYTAACEKAHREDASVSRGTAGDFIKWLYRQNIYIHFPHPTGGEDET